MIKSSAHSNFVPGEEFLVSWLQKPVAFSIKNKTIKKGRLLLFRRAHYFVQIAIQTSKNTRENFDVPIPFAIEHHEEEGLLYFDYRLDSLNVSALPKMPDKISSIYFNNILEIQTV